MKATKRALVLTPRFPYPETRGDRIRILRVCRALRQRYELTLLTLCETTEEMRFQPGDDLFARIERVYLPRWKSYLNSASAVLSSRPLQLAYYQSSKFRSAVASLLPQHDLAVAHLIRTGQYLEDLPGPRILEMTDAISMTYLRMRQLTGNYNWKKLVFVTEQHRLKKYEMRTVRKFNRVWITSELDRNFVDPGRASPIEVIPNGVDLEDLPYSPPLASANVIVFIANMASLQNQDAGRYFIENILPRVRERADVQFRIVGSAPDTIGHQFSRYPNVQVTGFLEHIRDGVKGAFCGICPVRAAAGIQNKVLEYFALGIPCVTNTIGAGGVQGKPGEHFLVYHDPDEAARHILTLHSDPVLRTRMAASARSLVCDKYDWRTINQALINSSLSCQGVSPSAQAVSRLTEQQPLLCAGGASSPQGEGSPE